MMPSGHFNSSPSIFDAGQLAGFKYIATKRDFNPINFALGTRGIYAVPLNNYWYIRGKQFFFLSSPLRITAKFTNERGARLKLLVRGERPLSKGFP